MVDDPQGSDREAGAGRRDRPRRLAAAMRANLQRRKRQQRARELEPQPAGEAGEPVEPG